MTDIGGGIFSLVVTAIFLQFWKPQEEWHFDKAMDDRRTDPRKRKRRRRPIAHAAEAAALRRPRRADALATTSR